MPYDHLVQNGHRSMTKYPIVVMKRSLVSIFLVVCSTFCMGLVTFDVEQVTGGVASNISLYYKI